MIVVLVVAAILVGGYFVALGLVMRIRAYQMWRAACNGDYLERRDRIGSDDGSDRVDSDDHRDSRRAVQ